MLDTHTGRWLSADPLGFGAGDTNLYRYVGNNPVTQTDPSGLADPDKKSPFVPGKSAINCHDSGRTPDSPIDLRLLLGPKSADPKPTVTDDELDQFIKKVQARGAALDAELQKKWTLLQDMVQEAFQAEAVNTPWSPGLKWGPGHPEYDKIFAPPVRQDPNVPHFAPPLSEREQKFQQLQQERKEADQRYQAAYEKQRLQSQSWATNFDSNLIGQAHAFDMRDDAEVWNKLTPTQQYASMWMKTFLWSLTTGNFGGPIAAMGMVGPRSLQVTSLASGGYRIAQGKRAVELSQAELTALRSMDPRVPGPHNRAIGKLNAPPARKNLFRRRQRTT